MPGKKATITDIATAAGVSKTTVSRYINGHYDLISDATRKRIEKAIKLAHYRPSAVARSLKTQRSYLVGVIVTNITTPFATLLIDGVSSGLAEGGYIPIFGNAADSIETEHRLLDSLSSHQVDGLIVSTTSASNPKLVALAEAGMPVVLCDRSVNNYQFDIVMTPDEAPTRALMEHLHEQGYRRAALFTQEYENNTPRAFRHDAFIAVDRELFGATEPESDVYMVDPWNPASMKRAVEELRACAGTAEGPIGVYAANTATLFATYSVCNELGVSMPDELGLCGPDDWGRAHHMGWNWLDTLGGGITTFVTDPYQMGYEAAKLMIERIADPTGKTRSIELDTKLELRGSTCLKGR